MAKIIKRNIVEEVKESFKEYALDTITDRAIPSIMDGLKPVQRKIMYTLWELGLNHKTARRKVNTIAGQTLRYSVHGDASVSGSIVVMGQWWKQSVNMIDGMGNFGNIDGSTNGASRYIEARLSSYSDEVLLGDMSKGTECVEWMKSYDDRLDEPVYLPAKLPNLLINGSLSGIAVGYMSNHLPHNPLDVITLCQSYVKNRDMSIDEMISIIKAPDFPTGGVINGLESVVRGYTTGKGSVLLRGRYKTREEKGYTTVSIYQIPFGTNTEQLQIQIATISDAGKIGLVRGSLADHTDMSGVKLEFTIKKDEDLERVMNVIYKETDFETRINMSSYILTRDKHLKLATLKDTVSEFVAFREETLYKKFKEELAEKNKRIHILDALVIISKDMDNAIGLIRKSKGKQDAKERLMKKYKLDDVQAEYVVTMAVYRLSTMEIQAVIDEQNNLKKRCKELMAWTKTVSNKYIDKIMIDEWEELRNIFKGYEKRKTKLQTVYEHINTQDIVRNDPVTVVVTKDGYVKKFAGHSIVPTDEEIRMTMTDGDNVHHILRTYESKTLIVITDRSHVFNIKVHTLDYNKRGKLLRNIVLAKDYENVLSIWEDSDDRDVLTISADGMVKSTKVDNLRNISNNGKLVQDIGRKGVLVGVCRTELDKDIVIVTKKGMVLNTVNNIRPTGTGGVGVIAIKLRDQDSVAGLVDSKSKLCLITSDAKLKTMKLADFRSVGRGGYGVIGLACEDDDYIIGVMSDEFESYYIDGGKGRGLRIYMGEPFKKTAKPLDIRGMQISHVEYVTYWR